MKSAVRHHKKFLKSNLRSFLTQDLESTGLAENTHSYLRLLVHSEDGRQVLNSCPKTFFTLSSTCSPPDKVALLLLLSISYLVVMT